MYDYLEEDKRAEYRLDKHHELFGNACNDWHDCPDCQGNGYIQCSVEELRDWIDCFSDLAIEEDEINKEWMESQKGDLDWGRFTCPFCNEGRVENV